MEISKEALSHERAMLRKYNQVKYEINLYEQMALYSYKEVDQNVGGSRSVAVVLHLLQDAYIAKMDIPSINCHRDLIAKVDTFRDQLDDENQPAVLELRYLTADINENGQRQVPALLQHMLPDKLLCMTATLMPPIFIGYHT